MTTKAAVDVSVIGHLVRRAAFGAPAAELERLAARGYDDVVEDLLHPERFPRLEEDLLDRYHSEHVPELDYQWTASRWLFRMINSQRPLEEKMALMWHGIFATGAAKVVNPPTMAAHYEMLRDHGLGNFRNLLQRLSRDPAMLYWLDQQTNHGSAVNENYGRELLELFSMGRGSYTEDDVRACARAFTGWSIDQVIPRYPYGYYQASFGYHEEDHDHGIKSFLGKSGDWSGDEAINIIVEHPATAQFVGRKLYGFFVSDEPDQPAIDVLAREFTRSGFELRPVLKTLFHSDFFKAARYKHVKSPAEFVAGTVRLTGNHSDPYEFGLSKLAQETTLMGQQLLNPPTVEGWHTGREWIDSSYLMQRVNFAAEKFGNPLNPGVAAMIGRIARGRNAIGPGELLDACLYELGAVELMPSTREALLHELGLMDRVPCGPQDRPGFEAIACDVFRLIGASREYQLA